MVLAKNDLEALFPSFPIVDTLTLPLIEIGDEKEADLPDLACDCQPNKSRAAPCAPLDEWMRDQEKQYLTQN